MAGNLLPVHDKVLKGLLILDSFRGEDSTGIATVGKFKDAEVTVAKQVGNPWNLFESRSYEDAMQGLQRAIIGHNRYATMGGVKRQTAHPFENDILVGAHNGTLHNKHALLDGYKFAVDSEALYHHIAVEGLDDALQVADGAWSLVWWDKVDETLNFVRNKERPMWIAETCDKQGQKDGQQMFWASERWMLEQVLWRSGIAHVEPWQTAEDTHICIPVETCGKFGEWAVRKMPEKVAKVLPSRPVPITVATSVPRLVSNVVELKKDSEPKKESGGSLPPVFDRAYLRKTGVSFEVLCDKVDVSDNDYLILSDPNHPYKEIRLYPHKTAAVWDYIGKWIEGDIKGVQDHPTTPGKVYYVVNPESIILPANPVTVPFSSSSATVDQVVFNAMGLTCDWCSSPLIFGDANKFTTTKECFCPSCAEQEDVKQAVKFA